MQRVMPDWVVSSDAAVAAYQRRVPELAHWPPVLDMLPQGRQRKLRRCAGVAAKHAPSS